MKGKVYITYKLPEQALSKLREKCEVHVNENDRAMTKEELCNNLKGMDAVICMLSDKIDHEVIDNAEGVKIFANYAVGYNNIDFEYAATKGIAVSNTPGVLTDATADMAWALLFSVARRIVDSDRFTRGGQFTGWAPTLFLGQDITGQTLGILGAGRIGSNFAKKAKGFDMKIIYHNRKPNKQFEEETGATYVDLGTVITQSDFLSIHVPLTEETRHMISSKEFEMMKRNAILINTSRGPVVDEKALVDALQRRLIWGAGLDVYENEPAIEKGLFMLENVVLAPHTGSGTNNTRNRMVEMVVENVLSILVGKIPPNCVNPRYHLSLGLSLGDSYHQI